MRTSDGRGTIKKRASLTLTHRNGAIIKRGGVD
jgi:hypothetical protein